MLRSPLLLSVGLVLACVPRAAEGLNFDFDGDEDGWTAGACASLASGDGAAILDLTCTQGELVSPPLSLDAGLHHVVEFVVSGDYNGAIDLRFTTASGTFVRRDAGYLVGGQGARQVAIPTGGEGWAGTITGVTLVFTDAGGAKLEVDRIAIATAPWRGAWTFQEDGDLEGWSASESVESLVAAGGSLNGSVSTATSTPARLNAPGWVRLDARSWRTLMVEIAAANPTAGQQLRVWWGTAQAPSLNISRSMTVPYAADGTSQTVRFDLYRHAKWRGEIVALWVQPFSAPTDGASFTIDGISFAPRLELDPGSAGDLPAEGIVGLRSTQDGLTGVITGAGGLIVVPLRAPAGPWAHLALTGSIEPGVDCTVGISFQKEWGGAWTPLGEVPAFVCDGSPQTVLVAAEDLSWSGDIAALRLELPGGAAERAFAIQRLRFVASGASFELASVEVPYPLIVGDDIPMSVTVSNLGSEAKAGAKVIVAGLPLVFPSIEPLQSMTKTTTVPGATFCGQIDKQSITAIGQFSDGGPWNQPITRPLQWLDPLPTLPPEVPPPGFGASSLILDDGVLLQNGALRVVFRTDTCLAGHGEMRVFAAKDGAWQHVGGRIGLAGIALQTDAGVVSERLTGAQPLPITIVEGKPALPLEQTWTAPDGATWSFVWVYALDHDAPRLSVTLTATPSAPQSLLALTAGGIEVGLATGAATTLQAGVAGGLELLGSGQSGSSSRALVTVDHDRRTSHALLPALPVAAVQTGGITVGITWDPNTPWAGGSIRPALRFESPYVTEGRETHLIELMAPNVPAYVPAGAAMASTAYPVSAGQTVTLTSDLFVLAEGGPAGAAELALAKTSLPQPTAIKEADARAAVTDGLTTTWNPGLGWPLAAGATPTMPADVAAAATALGALEEDAALVSIGAAAASATTGSVSGEWPVVDTPWHAGPVLSPLLATWAELQAQAAASWLGEHPYGGPGYPSAGRFRLAWRLLAFARRTGLDEALALGLAELSALNAITVPTGGMLDLQVHASAPDVFAITDALMASLEAWRLTAAPDHLAAARRWARLAMSFVQLDDLGAPNGTARYGVVAGVAGHNFRDSLLGRLNATAGLRLSLALGALSAEQPDPDTIEWGTVAEGLANAVVKRLEKGPDNGLFREAFDFRRNAALGPLRLPHLLARVLLARAGAPLEAVTQTVDTPAGASLSVTSAKALGSLAFDVPTWSVVLGVPAGAPVLTIGGLDAAPPGITVNGATLAQAAELQTASQGWLHSPELALVWIKLPPGASGTVAVTFPIPDGDEDGFPANLDCDDAEPKVNPEATETCNAIDDDCDGETDEPEATGYVSCGIGACDHEEPACVLGEAATCDPFAGALDEVCDDVDNDCDGETDEGVGTVVCGLGVCAHTIDACAVCDPFENAEPEVCDSVDNDCDGETDETIGTILCGVGACEHLISACAPCDPLVGAGEEVCNLIDDDCDGQTDEGLPTVPCGIGQCTHDIPACAACVADEGATPETCDGVDNDCDGQTDEDTPTKSCGLGECQAEIPSCHECAPFEGAVPEVCDGKDNDCNGEIDDAAGVKPCGTGQCYSEIPKCADCVAKSGATGEVCDGVDNDCDGETDEVTGVAICGLGVCAHEVSGCAACDPDAGKGEETCNALDDDCDGETDEAADLGTFECGVGACAHEVPNCTGGEKTDCDGLLGAGPEVCNGIDDDCDGVTDEEIEIWTCGAGACAHELTGCILEGPGSCEPLDGAADETCNGVDDDCDGETDEGLGTISCSGLLIECESTVSACVNGEALECDPFTGLPPEVCNGEDDDCDGETDEEIPQTVCGVGACVHASPSCIDGAPAACDPLEGVTPETCNFIDDDCDGETDEESPEVTCGLGICERTVSGCKNGLPLPCEPLNVSKPDVCNGEDDDCDGQTDEGLGDLTCGLGVCQTTIPVCVAGVPQQCDEATGQAPELCNGEDDDCDGETDEDLGTLECGVAVCLRLIPACAEGEPAQCNPFLGSKPEVCNGVDDDCDGQTDEELGELTCPNPSGGVVKITACVAGAPTTCSGNKPNDPDGRTAEEEPQAPSGGGGCSSGRTPVGGGATLLAVFLLLVWFRRRGA